MASMERLSSSPEASPFKLTSPLLNTPLFQSEPCVVEEDEAFVCEGKFADYPIIDDRTGALAIECWNLRKTVLDLNSTTVKLERELKMHKNLVRNQKKLVQDVMEENRARIRESGALKAKLADLEKKMQETKMSNESLASHIERYKKVVSTLTGKFHTAEREKKDQVSEKNAQIKRMEEEHLATSTSLQSQIASLTSEQQRLVNENSSLKALLRDGSQKAQELMEHTDLLTAELERARERNENSSDLLNKELEGAYEELHGKLERVWAERVEAGRKLYFQERENQQLLGFILSEGLELPDFPRPPSPPPLGNYK